LRRDRAKKNRCASAVFVDLRQYVGLRCVSAKKGAQSQQWRGLQIVDKRYQVAPGAAENSVSCDAIRRWHRFLSL
jgi:hypothetical protein